MKHRALGAVVVDPQAVIAGGVEVAVHRGHSAEHVGRTTNVVPAGIEALVGVGTQQFVLAAVPAKRIGVGPAFAGDVDA